MTTGNVSHERWADDLSPRRASLEYWFFSVRIGDLGFLVDFIVRTAHGADVEVRVSRWVRGAGTVERTTEPIIGGEGIMAAGAARLGAGASRGRVGRSAWELSWELGSRRVDARPPTGPFHPGDLELIALPDVRFSGWVEVDGERFEIDRVPGVLTHYWGRRLPDRWIWISASQFPAEPGRRVEALQAWTKSWGHGPDLPIGYVWTTDGRRDQLTLSPVNGLVRGRTRVAATGDGLATSIASIRFDGSRHHIQVSAPTVSFNDLGEGIAQTLLADLTFDGIPAAPSSVGYEVRGG